MNLMVRLALVVGPALLGGCVTGPGPGNEDTSTTPTTPTTPTSDGPEALCSVDVECYGSILDDPKAPCAMVVTNAQGDVVYDGMAGFELRGRSSLAFPKPQYGIELRSYSQLEVWPGAGWRYLSDGSEPGAGWREPGFDDSSWPEAWGALGFGADWLATTIEPSRTTFLRHTFEVDSAAAGEEVEIGYLRTDGIAIWLNGVEILREGLPADAGADTWATDSVSPTLAIWSELELDASALVDGENVLAVEIHQAEASPDDLRFDLFVDVSTEAEADFFGMGAEADWILNGQYADRALYRNRLAYDLFQSFGDKDRYAPQSRFCELALNGEERGVYTLGESIKRGDDRVDFDNDGPPGEAFLIKLDDEPGFRPNAVGYGNWEVVYPNDPDEEELAAIDAFLDGWEAAITGPDPADPEAGVFAYLDLDSAVDFVLLQELMKNVDAYQLSVHMWREPDGKLHFTPWDFDLTLGYPVDDCGPEGWNYRETWANGDVIQLRWIQAIAAVPEFRTALAARWRELREGPLTEEAILGHIDGYQSVLAPAIDDNFDLWPIESITFTAGGDTNQLCPVSSYEEEHARVLDFIRGRLVWMDEHIESF